MLGNKQIMANNIRYYMELNNVNSMEVCKALGFKQNTFSDWINAKIYPRIDKIEKMANYFGITKADLVEDRPRSFNSPEEFESEWQSLGGAPHPEFVVPWTERGAKNTPVLTDDEMELIIVYRNASEDKRKQAKRLLMYAALMKEVDNANR